MDDEYQAQLRERLSIKRRLYHEREMQKAKAGMMCDPAILIAAEDLAKEIRQIEAELGYERAKPARYVEPEPIFQERMVGQRTIARHADIEHQMVLLRTHRANLAHYRAQAKAFGGIDLAPPITRHGMHEGRAGIQQAKRALAQLGQAVDDLPGDE